MGRRLQNTNATVSKVESPRSQGRRVLVLRLGWRTWSGQEDPPLIFRWAIDRES